MHIHFYPSYHFKFVNYILLHLLPTVKHKIKIFTFVSNGNSLDWKDPTPAQMVERITSKLTSGSIILMHNGAKNTPEALPQIIDAVRAQGYEFVPISQIILEGDYTTDHEGRMHLSE